MLDLYLKKIKKTILKNNKIPKKNRKKFEKLIRNFNLPKPTLILNNKF